MPNIKITIDNFIFISSAIISGTICYLTLGYGNITLGIISVMFTFLIYSAKPNNGDYAYTFLWLSIIMISCFIGISLKLSLGFYLFLFAISNYYYISFNRDVLSDRAIPFVVIYASLGTTIESMDYQSVIAFFIGTVVALVILGVGHKNKIEFKAFKTGLFSRSLYKNPPHVLYSSLLYSCLLFLCLYLPDMMGLERAYWAPMTFIILLKPKENNTIKNTIDRFIGCTGGAIMVFLIMKLDVNYQIINWILVVVFVFFLPSFYKLNNLPKSFAITVFILLLLEMAEFNKDPNYNLPYARICETFIGGALAIIGSVTLKFLRKHSKHFV